MKTLKTVYISGRISGLEREDYLKSFAEAEEKLKTYGYNVVNPTKFLPSRFLWIYKIMGYKLTLLYDLWHLFDCNFIFMLNGWEHSQGARLEKALADIFGIKELKQWD